MSAAMNRHLTHVVQNKRLLICLGPGGVGKTTVSSALAVLGAQQGKKTLVITIDPAKRLAQALGLSDKLNTSKRVPLEYLKQAGIEASGQLDAMMLDLPTAWDDMITRLVDDKQVASAILSNRFYRYLSTQVVGAEEFIAGEQLWELAQNADYDLIVLDTPPSNHALDFLDAPRRILNFIDQDAFALFMKLRGGMFGRVSSFFAGSALGLAGKMLEKVTGATLLNELYQFWELLAEIATPLSKRIGSFQRLLHSDETSFVAVTSPKTVALNETSLLLRELKARHLQPHMTIINGVTSACNKVTLAKAAHALPITLKNHKVDADTSERVVGSVRTLFEEHEMMVSAEQKNIAVFYAAEHQRLPIIQLPKLAFGVSSLRGINDLLIAAASGPL